MPNHCCNLLYLQPDALIEITGKYVRKNEHNEDVFDFELIVPVGEVEDWYKQRCEKWGTKWTGYDLNIGETVIDFFTAWSPPVPIIKKLAELHKNIEFRLEYYETGCAFRSVATAKWQDGEALLDDQCWEMTQKDLEELGLVDPEDEEENENALQEET